MSKRSQQKQEIEVRVMFEPHRRQQALLRAAYAQVLPELRRLVSGRPSVDGSQAESVGDVERKSAG